MTLLYYFIHQIFEQKQNSTICQCRMKIILQEGDLSIHQNKVIFVDCLLFVAILPTDYIFVNIYYHIQGIKAQK